jgi:hypothetical protein
MREAIPTFLDNDLANGLIVVCLALSASAVHGNVLSLVCIIKK